MIFNPLQLVDGLIGLGKEFVVDKDKQIEFAFKSQELVFKTMQALLLAKTNPWVDGAVKLLYALQTFWRPLVGGCMTLFGAFCHWKGIDLGNSALIFDGAFPAWGASRHVEKVAKAKRRKVVQDDDGDEW